VCIEGSMQFQMSYDSEQHTPRTRLDYSHFESAESNVVDASNGTFSGNEGTAATSSDPNMVLTGIMMGLVILFSLMLCCLTLPPLIYWLRRRIPVSTAQIQRRFETIEGWLITKVRHAAGGMSQIVHCLSIVLIGLRLCH
jgi:hypothetical protein